MHASVAFGTKCYQILLRIIAGLAAEFFVMEFKIGRCATRLASPAVATQHLLAQIVILIGIEPHVHMLIKVDTKTLAEIIINSQCFAYSSDGR
jgi:hypothetical protein